MNIDFVRVLVNAAGGRGALSMHLEDNEGLTPLRSAYSPRVAALLRRVRHAVAVHKHLYFSADFSLSLGHDFADHVVVYDD